MADSVDVQISPNDEVENSVFVSPLDPNLILVGNNRNTATGLRVVFWTSIDGGRNWQSNFAVPSEFAADPSAGISGSPSIAPGDPQYKGRLLSSFLKTSQKAQWFRYKSHHNDDWAEVPVYGLPTDKPHMWVDNSLNSPPNHRYHIYISWMKDEEVPPLLGQLSIMLTRSGDNGEHWFDTYFLSTQTAISTTNPAPNIQTGRTGRVYVIWGRNTADFGFAESNEAQPEFQFHPSVTIPLGTVNGFASMAVDKSDPTQDHLYVVWRGPGQVAEDYDVHVVKGSVNLGQPSSTVSWSTNPALIGRVSQNPSIQTYPWITWDECTGMIAVTWLDSRNPLGRETFVAVASTRDANGEFLDASALRWTEIKVSDAPWSSLPATAIPVNYDYIGIAAGDGRVFPVWSDDRSGVFKPYTSAILLWGVQEPSVATGFRNSMDGSITAITSWETNLDADTGDQFRLVSPSQQTFVTPETPPLQDRDHGAELTSLPCQEGTWSYVVSSRRSGCNFKRESDSVTLRIPFDAKMVPLITTNRYQGVAFGDYDSDGDADLYLTNKVGPNRLLSNEGRADIGGPGFGRFVDVTTAPLDNGDPSNAAAWGDYDNDGKLDLCLANGRLVPEGPAFANKLFRNLGAGNFVDATTGPLATAEESRGIIWVDYDNDGKLDLFVVNHGVPCRLLRGDGTGAFTDVTSSPLTATNATAAAWADFDNDRDVDLYLVTDGTSMPSELFRNLGNGTFEQLGPPFYVLRDFGEGQSAAWGDYDNDRDLDLILVKSNAYRLFRNDGTSFVERQAPLSIDTCRGIAWGDYDNDGDLDLYGTNEGPNQLYTNTNGTFSQVVDGVLSDPGSGRGVAWADYDGDGDLDLYFANDTGGNQSIRNTPCNPKHWLHVNLVGAADPVRTVAVSNRSAIGARVRAVVGALSRVQEISGGSGYGSQNSLTAEFGLGSSTLVDTVEVRWPGGEIRKEVQIATDQVLSVQEWIHSVQVTSTQFCQGTAKKWRIVVAWQTVVPTSDTDVLEIYPASNCETGGPPYTIRTAPPQPGGLQHSVTYEGPCVVGAWRFTIRSSNGTSAAAEFCRPVVVNSCPSCTNCPPTGCEIE